MSRSSATTSRLFREPAAPSAAKRMRLEFPFLGLIFPPTRDRFLESSRNRPIPGAFESEHDVQHFFGGRFPPMKKIDCEFCSLRAQPDVICHLAGGALADFRALSTPGLYKPRQVIFSEGGSAGGLYLVCNGAVKLYNSDRFGRDHILEIAGPGSLLGELPVDPSQGLSTSAETICESQLCFLSREGVERLIELHPETALRLIAALSSELALARRKVRDLALKGAEGRLASLLLQLASGQPSPGDRLLLRYRRSEIAEMIGVSTETAIRLFGKLRQKHLIAAEGKEILILDRERLGKVASYDKTET